MRELAHEADPAVVETVKRTDRPYFVLEGNICALLAAKDHVNVFLYDGGIVPDPEGIITGGHENKTARTVAVRRGGGRSTQVPSGAILKQIIADNRAGGWRKLKAIDAERSPSAVALDQVRGLAGPSAAIASIEALKGGQHAATWKVATTSPELRVVVREIPVGDSAAECETRVLQVLDGLSGLAPVLLGSDLDGDWSERPTTLISWLDGEAEIPPTDPDAWATQLARTLALMHTLPREELSALPGLLDQRGGSRRCWPAPSSPRGVRLGSDRGLPGGPHARRLLVGNVIWRDGMLSGVVDWSGATRGPRGFDVAWCRLDLYLLFDQRLADLFLAANQDAAGQTFVDIAMWDAWALARSHGFVESWVANYLPSGSRRPRRGPAILRRRHSEWAARIT